MIRYVQKTYYHNDAIQIVFKDRLQYSYAGNAIVENHEIVGVLVNTKVYDIIDVHAIAPLDSPIDLGKLVFKKYLIETAQALADGIGNPEHRTEISTNMIEYTEYQKVLFESCYHDKSHLNHVNWFAPSACYYPKGWFDLGGTQSKKSDIIGEQVDLAWQSWRMALLKNMFLENINPLKITYQGS